MSPGIPHTCVSSFILNLLCLNFIAEAVTKEGKDVLTMSELQNYVRVEDLEKLTKEKEQTFSSRNVISLWFNERDFDGLEFYDNSEVRFRTKGENCYIGKLFIVVFLVCLARKSSVPSADSWGTPYVMLCYVMLCYVMLCYVMLCYVMLCYVMLCYVMLCYVM